MALTTLQKRGSLTVPQSDRTRMHWPEGQLLLTTVLPPDRLVLRAIPDAETLWPQYQSACVREPSNSAPPLTGRWLPAAALWQAQADSASPWRALWQALSQGMQTRRCDPTMLATWADQMATVFPTLARADHATYLEAVCAWPGVDLPDRAFWLTVCAAWGQSDQAWSDRVWQLRDADTEEIAPADTDETPAGDPEAP
jgi:hypothetical protein